MRGRFLLQGNSIGIVRIVILLTSRGYKRNKEILQEKSQEIDLETSQLLEKLELLMTLRNNTRASVYRQLRGR